MFAAKKDFYEVLQSLSEANTDWQNQARERQAQLTKPPGSLGKLEELAVFLAGWGQTPEPKATQAKVIIFAGNHGVTRQNISPYPMDVTKQMVANFENGGAAINALTGTLNIDLSVASLDLEKPTGDISCEPALNESELLDALNIGAHAVSAEIDVLCLGEMGIGNTTIAATLAAACFGGSGQDWAGAGTGLDNQGIAHKAKVIDQSLARYKQSTSHNNSKCAFDIMMHLGGRETAALVGAILAARQMRIPVILDGFVVSASAAVLLLAYEKALTHCISGHLSHEFAHKHLLEKMKLSPLLQLDMRLGEGTGAVLAVALLRGATAAHNEMATFEQAAVSNREKTEDSV